MLTGIQVPRYTCLYYYAWASIFHDRYKRREEKVVYKDGFFITVIKQGYADSDIFWNDNNNETILKP